MIQTVNISDFERAFKLHNRFDQFGYAALRILFDYLEETTPDYELDVIELCCSYACESAQDIASNYSIDLADAEGDDEQELEIVLEYLNEHSFVCGACVDGIVYCTDF